MNVMKIEKSIFTLAPSFKSRTLMFHGYTILFRYRYTSNLDPGVSFIDQLQVHVWKAREGSGRHPNPPTLPQSEPMVH